jgi:hypothetical protein
VLSPSPPNHNKRVSPDLLSRKDEQMFDKITVSNDELTVIKFHFSKDGNRSIKTGDIEGLCRQYYKCTTDGCEIQYCENYVKSKLDEIFVCVFTKNHNHYLPSNPKVRSQVKHRCLDLFRAGISVSVIHKYIVNDAPVLLTPENVPTLSQVKS